MDLQNITRKKPNPSLRLEPKTTKHTVKKPRTNNSFEINKGRHETKKALTSNIANKCKQREGPIRAIKGGYANTGAKNSTHRPIDLLQNAVHVGQEVMNPMKEGRRNDVGWRK